MRACRRRWGLVIVQITDHMISLKYAWINHLSLAMLDDKKMRDFALVNGTMVPYQPYSYVRNYVVCTPSISYLYLIIDNRP